MDYQPMQIAIMEHPKELLWVPLASLVLSRFNVRRHTAGRVEEQAALIESQGLLHNLVVTEQEVGRGKSRKVREIARRWPLPRMCRAETNSMTATPTMVSLARLLCRVPPSGRSRG